MALPDAAVAHDDRLRRLTLAVLLQMRRLWDRFGSGDWDTQWATLGGQMLAVMTAAQVAAGMVASTYVGDVVGELGLPPQADGQVSPRGLAGVASDGRPLGSLLYEAVIAARAAGKAQQLDSTAALAVGRGHLDRIVTTQVTDADRTASSVASVAHRGVTGWVRMAPSPCCPRCAILAGRFYRWSSGFDRHPQDDCTSIPATEDVAGDLTTDPRKLIESGSVRGLSTADTKAIVEDGADPGQVINAHRGMSTAQVYGETVKITNVGVTTRQRSQVPRLRPESIYKLAGDDRAEALRRLRRFGYLI